MQSSYHSSNPLRLIVEWEIVELEKFLHHVPQAWEVVSIGRKASAFLLVSSEFDKSRTLREWLVNKLRLKAPGPVVCTDIDLLFYPSLKLDPLVLFRQISRHTRLLVLWPGTYKSGVVSYAIPGHQHYQSWKNLEGIEVKGVNDAL